MDWVTISCLRHPWIAAIPLPALRIERVSRFTFWPREDGRWMSALGGTGTSIARTRASRSVAVAGPALLDRLAFLRRTGGSAHHHAFVLDQLTRICVSVLIRLQPAARIALDLERLRIALLLRRAPLLATPSPPSQHGSIMPARGYTTPLPGAFV